MPRAPLGPYQRPTGRDNEAMITGNSASQITSANFWSPEGLFERDDISLATRRFTARLGASQWVSHEPF